jgi:pilus assembly protein Flp/PilA
MEEGSSNLMEALNGSVYRWPDRRRGKRTNPRGKEEAMLSNISAALLRFVARFEREEGQALAEYGLILALIAVAAILALTALGVAIAGQLGAITAVMP